MGLNFLSAFRRSRPRRSARDDEEEEKETKVMFSGS